MSIITLDQVEPGNPVRIKSIQSQGSARRRIAEMGLSSGAEIDVIRRAPFDDPIELRVGGYNLSLRKSEAIYIIVERKEE